MDDPSPQQQPLPAGTRLSHYEIRGVLGRGGMGIVYRAFDNKLAREVAIKCLRPDLVSDAGMRARLSREARAAAALSHPGIVRVLDVLDLDGAPAIVMELVEGSSLREQIGRRGALPVEEVLRHGEVLAEALASAHARGILHRDVTPGNVLVTADGRAMLADFGLLRRTRTPAQESTLSTQSLPGMIAGTPGYIAPEALLGKTLDGRADIFSLGVVLYEMCTGTRAFSANTSGDFIDATLNREPQAIARLNYAVPAELERIVRKALAKRPDERYQDARELLADLRALRRRTESGSLAAEPGRAAPKRRVLFYSASAAAVLALAALLVLWMMHAGDDALPTATPRQLTKLPGLETEPSLSPDGTLVAYASDATGDFEIWIADTGSGQPLRLTHDPARDRMPAWYPDGGAIAFVSDRGGRASVWKVPRLGGSAVMLVPDAVDPSISPDGSKIAFVRTGEAGHLRIWVAPLDDVARARELSSPEGSFWDHRHPVWSPDGTTIIYADFDGLWILPAAGGKARRLTTSPVYEREPAWAPDGRHVYFSSSRGEARALWRVSLTTGTTTRLTFGTGGEGEPSLSRDGTRMAYATRDDDARIVLLDLRAGRRTELIDLQDASFPVIDREGTRVVFVSSRLGSSDLWSADLVEGRPAGEPMRLTEGGGVGTLTLSPDGRLVAYHRVIDGQRDVWIRPLQGGIPVNVTEHPAADLHPAWSPDGSRIVFTSDRGGQRDLWLLPLEGGRPGGPPSRLTHDAGTESFPVWSPDGSRIAYVADDGATSEVWDVSADGTGAPRRVSHGAGAFRAAWASHERLLVSGVWGGREIEVRFVRLADGATQSLVPRLVLGGEEALGDFSASFDGTLLAYVEQRSRGDVWLLEAVDDTF